MSIKLTPSSPNIVEIITYPVIDWKNVPNSRRNNVQKTCIPLRFLLVPRHFYENFLESVPAAGQFAQFPTALRSQIINDRAQILAVARHQRAAQEFAIGRRDVHAHDRSAFRETRRHFAKGSGDFGYDSAALESLSL